MGGFDPASFLGTAIVLLLFWAETLLSDRRTKFGRWCALGAIGFFAIAAFEYATVPQERELAGRLTPHQNICARLVSHHQPWLLFIKPIQLGNSGVTDVFLTPDQAPLSSSSSACLLTSQQLTHTAIACRYLTLMEMTINYDYPQDKLIISATFRDKEGHPIAILDKGKWVAANTQERSWDFNYTDDTLEVLNGDNKVALQIRVLADRIQLAGEA